MEILRYVVVALAVVAGIGVLRNPLKVWPNTLAGLSYLAGAIASLILKAWWPILAGWVASLVLQALCTAMISRGAFKAEVDAARAERGLPPRV